MERMARSFINGPTADVYHISSTPSHPSSFVFHPYVSFHFLCVYIHVCVCPRVSWCVVK
jgi:hypothetical protein